jgi:hypothetical protein
MTSDAKLTPLDQALLYGSISNLKECGDAVALNRLFQLLPKIRQTQNWKLRVINNYYYCIYDLNEATVFTEEGKESNLLNKIYYDLKDVLYNGLSMASILFTLYMSLFKTVQKSVPKSEPLQTYFNELINSLITDDNLRKWYSPDDSKVVYRVELGLSPLADIKQMSTREGGDMSNVFVVDNTNYKPIINAKQRKVLFDRIVLLTTAAPDYWKCVNEWYVYRVKDLDLSFTEMKQLHMADSSLVCIPEFKAEEVKLFTQLTWNMWKLPAPIRAYALGFPVQLGIPSPKIIKAALLRLASHGLDVYIKNIEALNEQSSRPLFFGLEFFKTDGDLLTHDFNAYNSFDCVSMVEDRFVYRFTRPSWASVIQTKLNPYNKQKIPPSVIDEMKLRTKIASDMGLPSPQTLRDMLSPSKDDHTTDLKHTIIITDLSSERPLPAILSALVNSSPSYGGNAEDTKEQLRNVLRSSPIGSMFGQIVQGLRMARNDGEREQIRATLRNSGVGYIVGSTVEALNGMGWDPENNTFSDPQALSDSSDE